jgi:hypothetical protein
VALFCFAGTGNHSKRVLALAQEKTRRKPWTFDKYIGWDFLSAYVTLQYFAMIHIFVYTVPQATLADNIRIFLTGLGY